MLTKCLSWANLATTQADPNDLISLQKMYVA
ncbi:hypothetical protein Pse7367_1764 [Thalassoporum mexicanum PCC 7367]|nr:hypothetical protein Pse7367_1764 [Pseudanabaena sp. PCC 7367]